MGRYGRVVIPADVRKAMDVKEGEDLLATLDRKGRLTLAAASGAERELWNMFAGIGRSLANELIDDRRAEARRETKG